MVNLILNFFLHPLAYIVPIADRLNGWVYLILFIWIFLETAYVIFSFLPGQSVLFLTSTIAASPRSNLNLFVLFVVFLAAATVGSVVKFHRGEKLSEGSKITQEIQASDQMEKTKDFFHRNEKSSLILSRFVPFLGLLVPIIAGNSDMSFHQFNKLNFLGALLWVSACCFAGYYLGSTPFVQKYFTLIFFILALLPVLTKQLFRFFHTKKA
ncbi:VTT domain-containing protein [Pediococcus siamensis]|uniref:VTT domain-containing protein n=1 Tax=Pediococcus siamensis TaxID=381829 RepID=UPI0039A09A74